MVKHNPRTRLQHILEAVRESFPGAKVSRADTGRENETQIWVDHPGGSSRFVNVDLADEVDETELIERVVDLLEERE
jgi:hypothetical protein